MLGDRKEKTDQRKWGGGGGISVHLGGVFSKVLTGRSPEQKERVRSRRWWEGGILWEQTESKTVSKGILGASVIVWTHRALKASVQHGGEPPSDGGIWEHKGVLGLRKCLGHERIPGLGVWAAGGLGRASGDLGSAEVTGG